jgi:hypothetical protein
MIADNHFWNLLASQKSPEFFRVEVAHPLLVKDDFTFLVDH